MTFSMSSRLAFQALSTLVIAIAVLCVLCDIEFALAADERSPTAATEPAAQTEAAPDSSDDERTQLERWLGNFHPVSVHFPIALLAVAALAELLWIFWSKPGFRFTSRFCLLLGAAGALLSATLGWFLAGYEWVDPQWELTTHRWLGTSTALLSPLVLALSEWSERREDAAWLRYLFRTTLLLSAALVSVTGFFGGVLVYGWEHYQWPQPTEETSSVEEEQGAAAVVEMNDAFRFDPESVTITAGETVLWKGVGKYEHTVTADPEQAIDADNFRVPEGAEPFHSGRVAPGETYSRTFDVPGSYRYFCVPHERAGMVGEIEVRPK